MSEHKPELWSDGEIVRPAIWFARRELNRTYFVAACLGAYAFVLTIAFLVNLEGACK